MFADAIIRFIGLIDILDLLAYAVTIFTESALKTNDVKLEDYTVKVRVFVFAADSNSVIASVSTSYLIISSC